MDEGLVGQYIAGLKQLKKRYHLGGEVGVSMLTHIGDLFPSVRSRRTMAVSASPAQGGQWRAQKLERSREREGPN
jgi:hypothetical protein